MKTKRLMSIVLALAMICTMFGNLTAFGAATWYPKYTFSITAVDNNGNNIDGVKYKISYTGINDIGTQETDEIDANGTTVEFVTEETTCTLTYTTIPDGYMRPSNIEMAITLDDSTEQFTNNNMTVTEINTETHIYNLGLTLQKQPILPSGSMTVTFKMKAQDAEGQEVPGVKYKVGDNEETAADGTSEATVTFGGYAVDSALSITTVPEGYKKPDMATFNTATLEDDLKKAGYEATVTSTGLDAYSVELTLTLENDTDDGKTYNISIAENYSSQFATITTSTETAKPGDKVEVYVKLKDGCDCAYITWQDSDELSNDDHQGAESTYTTKDDGNRVYEVTMPEYNIVFSAYLYEIVYKYYMYMDFEGKEINVNDLKYKVTVDETVGDEKSFNEDYDATIMADLEFPYSDKGKTVKFEFTSVPSGYQKTAEFTFVCGEKPDYDSVSDNFTYLYGDDSTWHTVVKLDPVKISKLAVMAQGQNEQLPEDSVKYTLTVDGTTTEEITMKSSEFFDVDSLNVNGKDATITVTQVPDGYLVPDPISFAFDGNSEAFKDTQYQLMSVNENSDTGKATYAILVTLKKKPFETPFTVSAKVNSSTVDKNADTYGVQVNAKDTVKVDVVVSGGDFTNADWEMVYDPTLFEYKSTTTNVDTTKGTVTTDDTKTAVLSGKLIANAGITSGNEFTDGTAIVTYEFKALAQNADKVGTFKIESAHANNYTIAGTDDNKVANTENATVEIVLVDDTEDKDEENGTVTVPAGTFTAEEKTYNAQKQTGNAFELADEFKNAKVTYFANEDGSAVADTTELENKSFKTTLPSWKNVGEYTYYAKIYGDGLKTTYVSTTLTIKPAELIPSAMFKVDPDVNEVEFTPTLEGVLDETHKGTVTVKYTDKDGEQTKTLEASDFKHDGETTSVYNDSIKLTAPTSGEFVVTLTYNDGEGDNYKGTTNTAKVDVDKITADSDTVKALEETITSVFGYDAMAHSVTVDGEAVAAIEEGDWKYTVSDEDATVTNVGEDKMVKVTFTDKNGVYNDVIVYVILKVTPANVKITVDDRSKVMNDVDPELTGTVKVVDEDGNEVTGVKFNQNGLYGEDNLEVSYEREAGEAVGKYDITASYAPNDNYTVTVENGKFEITAPSTDDSDPDNPAKVKIEVVDHSYETDGTPDYTANKRLILVYTDLDKLFYGYSATQSAEDAEKMFDVTAAGYKYTKYTYAEDGTVTATVDDTEYKHIYGIVVDKLESEETGAALEALYKANVVFLSSDLKDAPENIVYDGDINLSNEIDVNDYSMTNGIYNNAYARETYIKNILKADTDGDKKVDTTDVLNVKQLFEAKNK